MAALPAPRTIYKANQCLIVEGLSKKPPDLPATILQVIRGDLDTVGHADNAKIKSTIRSKLIPLDSGK